MNTTNIKIGDILRCVRAPQGRPGEAGDRARVLAILGEATVILRMHEHPNVVPFNARLRVGRWVSAGADLPKASANAVLEVKKTAAAEVSESTGPDPRFVSDHVVISGGRVAFGPAPLADARAFKEQHHANDHSFVARLAVSQSPFATPKKSEHGAGTHRVLLVKPVSIAHKTSSETGRWATAMAAR